MPKEAPKWVRWIGILRIYFIYCLLRNILGFIRGIGLDFFLDFTELDIYPISIILLIILALFIAFLALIYNIRTITLELKIDPRLFAPIFIRWTSILINLYFIFSLVNFIYALLVSQIGFYFPMRDVIFFRSNFAVLYADIFYLRQYRKQKNALQKQDVS